MIIIYLIHMKGILHICFIGFHRFFT
jgi:hypothetical protein